MTVPDILPPGVAHADLDVNDGAQARTFTPAQVCLICDAESGVDHDPIGG